MKKENESTEIEKNLPKITQSSIQEYMLARLMCFLLILYTLLGNKEMGGECIPVRFTTFLYLAAPLIIITSIYRHVIYHANVYIYVYYVISICWNEERNYLSSLHFSQACLYQLHELKQANRIPDILQVINLFLYLDHQHPLGIYISPAMCDYIKKYLSSLLLAVTKDNHRNMLSSLETTLLSSWNLLQVLYWFVYSC